MIKRTRKHLTVWFVSGIMLISLLMSILLFWVVDQQLQADYLRVQHRIEMQQNARLQGINSNKRTHNNLPMIDVGLNNSNLFIEELIEF